MNTEKEKEIIVHLNMGEYFKFIKCLSGLYFYVTNALNINTYTTNTTNIYVALQIVSNNKEYLIVNEIEEADKSRIYQ